MPVTDGLIKIHWKRLNSPPAGTPGAAGDGEEMLLAGFALPCPSDQTWMLHRNVSSLCNLHKLCSTRRSQQRWLLWTRWIICVQAATWRKWCQEKELEEKFLIKEPLSPSLITPQGYSLGFTLIKLFRTVIANWDTRLDKHRGKQGKMKSWNQRTKWNKR